MHALFLLPFLLSGDPAPLMPNGSSPEFQATAYKIEQFLGASKFEEAAKLLKRLPTKEVTLSWDDSGVPSEDKESYAKARDAAIADWSVAVPGLKVALKPKGEIKVSFKDILPPAMDSVLPAGAVFFTSDSPDEPRVEAVVGLKRDTPPSKVNVRHIQNEVGYAIGAYLGIAKLPRPVGYMGRLDETMVLILRVSPREMEVTKANFAFLEILKDAVAKKLPLQPTKPEMYINPTALDGKVTPQDVPMKFNLEVTNRGNAALSLRGFTECGCIHVASPTEIQPGQTGLIEVLVDTSQVIGEFNKTFTIYSNDPEKSEQNIRIKGWVTPKYRLLRESGTGTIVFSENALKQEFFLAIDQERPFKVSGVKINGMKAIVDIEPWEGTLPDVSLKEPAKMRKGYKVTMLASPTAVVGRVPVTFLFDTDMKAQPVIFETVYAQWGISAPKDVNFGEVPKAQVSTYFLVSRPGQPFKILSVDSDSDDVKATYEVLKNGDYKITTTMLATASVSRLNAKLTITTDDPKQPKIEVKVLAVVR